MEIDDSDAENIVLQKDGDSGGNTGVQSARSGGKRKDPDPAFTPGPEFEMEDEDENQGYTPVTRRTTRATRATGSPLNLRATKKAAQRAAVRVIESERKNAAEAVQGDQLALLHKLVESLLRQMQERDQKERERDEREKKLIDVVNKANEKTDKQGRTIEALRALSEGHVRKPLYSQAAQAGTTPPNEAQKVTVPCSPEESSAA
jgi:hypothetical protein